MTTSTPAQIGEYTVLRRLADGGMARALLARGRDGREVVLKIPLEPSSLMTTRLRDEAQAGLRVRHRHVVETLDFFIDGGHAVLVLEYIDGCALRDLRQLGGRANPLPAVAVAHLGRTIAEALTVVHTAVDETGAPLQMLHRDVTPSNILIGRDGVPKLIDLGIALSAENESERTTAGLLKGTLRYVSPELLQGGPYTPSSDLWSLGVCLFEAALGRMMVKGDPVAIFKALMGDQYRALRPGEQLDPDLAAAIFALVAPEEARLRNATAAAAIFGRLEQTLMARERNGYTGQHWLQTWVPWAKPSAETDDEPLLPPAAPLPPRIVLGSECHGTAATIAMPAYGSSAPAVAPAHREHSVWATSPNLVLKLQPTPLRVVPVVDERRTVVDVASAGAPTLLVPQWLPEDVRADASADDGNGASVAVDVGVDVDLGSLSEGLPVGSWDEDTAPISAVSARPLSLPTPPLAARTPSATFRPEAAAVPSSAMARPTVQMPIAAIQPKITEASEPSTTAPRPKPTSS